MKTLNNAVGIKLLSTITIILLLQSCSKDPKNGCYTPKDNYYYLTAEQLNQTPYFTNPAFDTISYTSDKGDTLTFVKTKTDTTWYTEKGNIGSPDCGYDQNFYQTIHNTYTTIKGNGNFDVKLDYKTETLGLFLLSVKFNQRLFAGISNNAIGIKFPENFFDDLILNGKSYKKVNKIFFIDWNIFINNSYGILKFEYLNDNTSWMYYEK